MSQACRMLNVGEELARRWYRTARVIMSADALRRQSKITHGCNGNLTTDIEADETCFCKWSEYDVEKDLGFANKQKQTRPLCVRA